MQLRITVAANMKGLPFKSHIIPGLALNKLYSPEPDAPQYTTGDELDDLVLERAGMQMGDNKKTRQLKEKMMLNVVKRLEDRLAFATPTKEPEEGGNEQGEDANTEIAVEEPEVEVVPRGLEQELAEEEKEEKQETQHIYTSMLPEGQPN
jgi:hypothetical protein